MMDDENWKKKKENLDLELLNLKKQVDRRLKKIRLR